jgi:hypothetical protein
MLGQGVGAVRKGGPAWWSGEGNIPGTTLILPRCRADASQLPNLVQPD